MFYTRPVRQDGYFLTKRKIPQHFYCGILAEKERFEHGQGHGPSPCLPDWLVESSNLLRLKKIPQHFCCGILAEKERFELSRPLWGLHDFQSCALDQLRDFSEYGLP